MQNNHFWTMNTQGSFDKSCQNNDFPPQNPYPFISSSSNLYFPFFYSPLHFQNCVPQPSQTFYLPRSYSNLSEVSFQSLPKQRNIKIENNDDCCSQKNEPSQLIHNQCQPKPDKKEFFSVNSQHSHLKSDKNQIKDPKNSNNNNLHKKQNQICDVEIQKNSSNRVSLPKTANSQASSILMLNQHTKELIAEILSTQKVQNEMLKPIKSQIVKLSSQFNKKQKRPVDELIDDIIKILNTKFTKFKKTKEEMIKYIFRKIFNSRNKPEQIDQNSWKVAQKVHRKNCSNFKSMNMKYVEKQFENPIFIELFSIFLNKFHVNFQKQNQERIDRLNKIVSSAIVCEDLTELKSYKKMPWNKNVVQNIEVLFQELKQIQSNSLKTFNVNELMREQQKEDNAMPEENENERRCFLWRQKNKLK